MCRCRVKRRRGTVRTSHGLGQRMCPESSRNKSEAVDGYCYQGNQGGIAMRYGSNRETFRQGCEVKAVLQEINLAAVHKLSKL